jgi:Spy/CpxP family protein refolding chaperone
MKRSRMIVGSFAFVILFAFLTGFLSSQPDQRVPVREDRLNLTPEQKTKIEEFRKARQEESKAFFEQMRKLRTDLREMMKDPQANEKKIDGLIDEMSKLRADRMKRGLRNSLEMKKIFTPEQLEKMKDFRMRMERRGMRFGAFHGPRGMKRMGPGRGMRPGRFFRRGLGPGWPQRPFLGDPPMRRWNRLAWDW